MTALDNRHHEEFARKLSDPGKTQTQAYKDAYPTVKNDHVASNNASRLLLNASVKARVVELLENRYATTKNGLTERLSEWVKSNQGAVSMDAIKTAFKLHGVLDSKDNDVDRSPVEAVRVDVHHHHHRPVSNDNSQPSKPTQYTAEDQPTQKVARPIVKPTNSQKEGQGGVAYKGGGGRG